MNLFFVSLGCDKNLVDSEYMIGMLREAGWDIIDDPAFAEVIIINTCCFIGDAKEESIQTILEMAAYKESGKCKALLISGCLAQRYQEEIKAELPEVDAMVGTNAYDDIVHAVEEALGHKHYENFHSLQGLPTLQTKRIVTTGGHFAYLKIAEGCNRHCSYCVIPSVRGPYRSLPLEELVAQAEGLAENGVKELILVAQETSLYGLDLYGEKSLPSLLDALNEIPGLYWIRILYAYPEEIDEPLIAAIQRNKKVCHYLDMPIQHANDRILQRMGRKTNQEALMKTIARLRQEIPDICLRTTLICGFPGETAKEHEELMEFVNEMEFDRLGVFPYSPEEGTPAFDFPDQVDEETKLNWSEELMELEQEIIFDKAKAQKNEKLWVFIEGKLADENVYVARSYRDAPDIDGYVFVSADSLDRELMTGDFVKVQVTGSQDYDLLADLISG